MMKKCTKCNLEQPRSHFHKHKRMKDGLQPICKHCKIKADKEYRLKNADKVKSKRKEWRDENPEKVAIIRKRYYQKNKETIAEKFKEYSQTEAGREVKKRSSAKRRALKINSEDGTITKQSLSELRELQNNKCYYCEEKLDFISENSVHLDHHIPLSKGGRHSIDNVKYTCKSCNLQKYSKMPTSLLLIFGGQHE